MFRSSCGWGFNAATAGLARVNGAGALILVVCLVCGCSPHASKVAPSQWGRGTVFLSPLVFELDLPAAEVQVGIKGVLDRLGLEIRWSNVTGVDGEYVFRSARQMKIKMTYQAIGRNQTRVEIYPTTHEEILPNVLLREIEAELKVRARVVDAPVVSDPKMGKEGQSAHAKQE